MGPFVRESLDIPLPFSVHVSQCDHLQTSLAGVTWLPGAFLRPVSSVKDHSPNCPSSEESGGRTAAFSMMVAVFAVSLLPGLVLAQCPVAGTIGCGQVINSTTVGGPSNINLYSCVAWNESGPELIYEFVSVDHAIVNVGLSNLGGIDLDLFVLPESCDPNQCLAFGNNVATFSAQKDETYYVVVDGFTGAAGSFTLTMSCLFNSIFEDRFELQLPASAGRVSSRPFNAGQGSARLPPD